MKGGKGDGPGLALNDSIESTRLLGKDGEYEDTRNLDNRQVLDLQKNKLKD